MRKLLCFFSLLVCIGTAGAQQRYTITGIVTDDKDVPIPGATVFINDSRKATATDADGKFTLAQIHPGKYNLVIKMIGYNAATNTFTLQNSGTRFRIKLHEDNIQLKTVNISSMSLSERKKHLATFIRCFFGTSSKAAQCSILNPDIIVLKYHKKTSILTANTDDFLVIENRALGYRLKYLLNNFLYDKSGLGLIAFDGTVFFEDLSGDARQKRRWEEQRAEVFQGSPMHFFRSLYNKSLGKNGFVVYEMLNRAALAVREKQLKSIPVKYFSSVKPYKHISVADSNLKAFDLRSFKKDSTELYVSYTRKAEPQEFLDGGAVISNTFGMPEGQKSILTPLNDTVFISKNGSVSPVGGIQLAGFWMWGKMAWALPTDYELPAQPEVAKIDDDETTD
jgi:hypothetical protein